MSLSRRRFLGLAALGLVGACRSGGGGGSSDTPVPPTATGPPPTATALAAPPADLPGNPFTLGVASGDPAPDSVVLWTRLLPEPAVGDMPDADVALVWDVALDPEFTRLVGAGSAVAAAASAHAVHVEAAGLPAGEWFHYRFRVGDHVSPVGRTRTAPPPGSVPEQLALAVASCQAYQDGYFTSYPHIVADTPDLVVFVGDYIYENAGAGPVRPVPGTEATDLAGYRDRYAHYKRDADLQAAQAACPWVVTWDDHEVDNNYAGGSPEGMSEQQRARRAAAYQAWWEHQPVRLPPPAGADLSINRVIAWGDLATFVVLDSRQHRSGQACGGGVTSLCPEAEAADRTMLGPGQEQWLADTLAATEAAWTVLAQQVIVADAKIFGVVNTDQWDGYPAARERLLTTLRDSGAPNPVVLTGDIHAGVAADLLLDDEPVAVEFVSPAISSGFPANYVTAFGALNGVAPGVAYANASRRGHLRCTVSADEWRTEYRLVDTVTEPTSPVATDATFVVRAGEPGLDEEA